MYWKIRIFSKLLQISFEVLLKKVYEIWLEIFMKIYSKL